MVHSITILKVTMMLIIRNQLRQLTHQNVVVDAQQELCLVLASKVLRNNVRQVA
jgi:hypothetical protein